MFTASNSQAKTHEGKRNQLMLSIVQPRSLNFFQLLILRKNTDVESSLSSRKKTPLIDDLKNVYKKMLIILCMIWKFCDEIMLVSKLLVLHFVTFRKQASTTHFLCFSRPRQSPVKEPCWQPQLLPSHRKLCLYVLSSLFLKNQGSS